MTRTEEVYQKWLELGDYDAIADELGICRETVTRQLRRYRQKTSEPSTSCDKNQKSDTITMDSSLNNTIRKLVERYSPEELKMIANGHQNQYEIYNPIHNFQGERLKLGIMTDLHIGSKFTDDDRILEAFDQFNQEDVDMVLLCGDITEGLSHRPNHALECSEIGYDAQKSKAIELLSQWKHTPMYMIDGNHDRWYIKSAGACIVKDICTEIPNAEFIGHDYGDIELAPNVKLTMWHGEDSSSYAISYRLQKIVESMSGGTKPNILICGHTHKFGTLFERNIHIISAGCMQRQTNWMRGKRIAAHVGFAVVDMVLNEVGVSRFKTEWFPFYI